MPGYIGIRARKRRRNIYFILFLSIVFIIIFYFFYDTETEKSPSTEIVSSEDNIIEVQKFSISKKDHELMIFEKDQKIELRDKKINSLNKKINALKDEMNILKDDNDKLVKSVKFLNSKIEIDLTENEIIKKQGENIC